MAQPRKICKPPEPIELPRDLVSFGPVYNQETNSASSSDESQGTAPPFLTEAKAIAMEHVLSQDIYAKDAYFNVMERIEGKARDAYAANPTQAGPQFREMMIKDGILFLHFAILILGGSAQLGYPQNHQLFGIQIQDQYMKRWIQSILFVGNQIPFVVLEELMKQSFFKRVICEMRLKRPSGLLETALYELLLTGLNNMRPPGIWGNLCQLLLNQLQWISRKMGFAERDLPEKQEPHDLIHSLHMLVLDGTHEAAGDVNNDFVDQLSQKGKVNIADEKKWKIPSAKQLSKIGIKIKKKNEVGSARIHFESNWLSAALYIPMFKAGITRQLILESLVDYEKAQDRQEMISYVKFMNELVREPADAKLLHDQGVIEGDLQQRTEFVEILKSLTKNSKAVSSRNMLNVRLQIKEHSPYKWPKWLQFIPMGVILGIVQTILNILTYRQGQNKCVCSYQSPPSPK